MSGVSGVSVTDHGARTVRFVAVDDDVVRFQQAPHLPGDGADDDRRRSPLRDKRRDAEKRPLLIHEPSELGLTGLRAGAATGDELGQTAVGGSCGIA